MTRRRQKDREDLTTGTLTLKVGEGELSCTSSVRLSAKETALMKLLMLNEGKTLSTELLLSHVWQDEEEKRSWRGLDIYFLSTGETSGHRQPLHHRR